MQVRGGLTQKDLAEQTDVGVSTMSRFLSQKSTELNPQLIAKITAKLNIPLHEMIDFVEEGFAERFIRLVKFYKNELDDDGSGIAAFESATPSPAPAVAASAGGESKAEGPKNVEPSLREKLESLTPRQRAFMTEFLNMKLEERDLIVDVGNNLFQYFKMKGMNL